MFKKNVLKNTLVSGLTLAMLIGGGASAFAQDKGDNDGGNKGNDRDIKIEIKIDFKDLDQAEWARKFIASLATKKVFDGYTDGTFKPKKYVSRIEAITAAVKLMGLKDEAMAKMNTDLNFRDGDKIEKKYSWAVGFVAEAAEKGLFSESETAVQPEKPADRLWATTLLVKALNLKAAAEARMNAKLPFRDAHQIPAGSVGYVAVASIDKQLVAGYKDNTFRPNRPITRAELAVLLDKTGDQMPGNEQNKVVGKVSAAVNGNVLTVETKQGAKQLTLDPNAFIYRDGVKVAASALQPGDQVVVRSYNNIVFFVEVLKPAQTNPNVNGTVVTAAVSNNTLFVSKDGTPVQYPLSPNAIIIRNNAIVTAADLKVGDEISIYVKDNAVVFVQVIKAAVVSGS